MEADNHVQMYQIYLHISAHKLWYARVINVSLENESKHLLLCA